MVEAELSLIPIHIQAGKKYLSIPGTSVPSECIFSKVGQIVSERRNRLKAKHVNTWYFKQQFI